MMYKLATLLFALPLILFAQSIENSVTEHGKGIIEINSVKPITNVVEMQTYRNTGVPARVTLTSKNENINSVPLMEATAKDVLYTNQHAAYRIDTKSKIAEYIPPVYNIAEECYEAINLAPKWLEDDLLLKFRELRSQLLDDDYAQVIIDAYNEMPEVVDEVAFTIAHLSVESLRDSRFRQTMDYPFLNAKHIYDIKDDLKYVDLVEYGDMESREYYTTAKYKIQNGFNGSADWVEIPYEYYYWYVVHPKLNAEGVYMAAKPTDTQQKTYGYHWRDFIWSNPDPEHDYTQVNMSTQLGSIETIPVFGDMMKEPEVLWNKIDTFYYFNRPLNHYDHALDLLGNWGSRAIPADPIVGDPRAIHPNQILYEHRGRCGEDSYLMTAACRTALIPTICVGTQREDHVFDQFWINDWNHFEFFRGGLAQDGWGWTNMMDRGYYEELSPDYWTLSFIHAYRPDGFIMNHTPYYTDVCTLKVRLVDNNELPLDGVKVSIFALPGHPGDNNILYSGQAFTDSDGRVVIEAGDRKVYYLQFYHPQFGYFPGDGQVYLFTNQYEYTVAGRTYDAGTMMLDVTSPNKLKSSTSMAVPESAQYGVHLQWSAKEIVTGVNSLDYQKSRFFYKNDTTGNVSFFLCDAENYELFKSGAEFESYATYNYTDSGDVYIALPDGDTWYVVLANNQALTNYEFVNTKCEFIEDAVTSIFVSGDPVTEVEELISDMETGFNVYPNPIIDKCRMQISTQAERVEIYDSFGRKVDEIVYPFIWTPAAELSNGTYFFKTYDGKQIRTTQAVLMR